MMGEYWPEKATEREHLAACLRIAVNGPAPEAFPYSQALELFFMKPRRTKCSDKQCHLAAYSILWIQATVSPARGQE
ncbi:hypothetical protein CesoFtcFv8_010654 [Champsocephalus esox]|uniref:Uncharacterized protein n=1 Tax=Champsocephalus esox TaxID=159716 RepID=A0AAN8H0Q4_9TELE|nr:hypothetical protein CesoFtcFv8_010654 [Champsocephalus esox]